MYRHQVRALRQIKWPLSFEAQLSGAVGHGMAGELVAEGAALDVLSWRGIMAAKVQVAGSRANINEALIVIVRGLCEA